MNAARDPSAALLRPLRWVRLWFALWLLAVAATVVVSLLPPSELPPLPANDKLAHLAAYAVLMAMAVQLIQRRSALLGAAVSLALLGAGLELAQGAFTARREADALDALANLLGVGLGASLARTRAATWLQRLLPP